MIPPTEVELLRAHVAAERARGAVYILETHAPARTADVARMAKARLGESCDVEPLFRRPSWYSFVPGQLEAFFLARVPDLCFADLPHSPYDWAYDIRGDGSFFRSVEPDTTFRLRRPVDPAEFGSTGLCFSEPAAEPPPHRWSLGAIEAPVVLSLSPPVGAARGEGIRVAHLDTGRAEHAALPDDAYDHYGEYDFIRGRDEATDPLDLTWSDPVYPEQPGHGTATGGVIAGREYSSDSILGVAPRAKLVSLRCIRSVIVSTTAATVARAIQHAADNNCHVVSMSLGGLPRRALQRAVSHAVDRGLIVTAAAGNCVGPVVAPAIYDACLAVAAVTRDNRPWRGSCSGAAVDVSAPGEFVWVASRGPGDAAPDGAHLRAARPGQGTSFAVAQVAGAAACWLAHHGRDELLTKYSGRQVQAAFQELVMRTARPGPDWDRANFGTGVLNVRELLEAEPPPAAGAVAAREETYFELLAAAAGPERAGELLRGQGRSGFESLGAANEFGAELLDLLYRTRSANLPATAESGWPTDPLIDRVRAFGSRRLRRAVGG